MTVKLDWASLRKEQRIAIITDHAKSGMTARQIADAFTGVSRNGVVGYVARYRIKLDRAQGAQETLKAKPATKAKASPRAEKPAAPLLQAAASAPALPAVDRKAAFEPLPGVHPVRIEDMPMLGRCRWPVNGFDGAEPIMCGRTSKLTEVYCASHQRLAYRKAA